MPKKHGRGEQHLSLATTSLVPKLVVPTQAPRIGGIAASNATLLLTPPMKKDTATMVISGQRSRRVDMNVAIVRGSATLSFFSVRGAASWLVSLVGIGCVEGVTCEV